MIDGNIPVAAATQIVHFAEEAGVKVWLVLVSPAKSVSLARAGILERVAFVRCAPIHICLVFTRL